MKALQQNWLLLDTSYTQGVVAIAMNGVIAAEYRLMHMHKHDCELPKAVDLCLQQLGLNKSHLHGIIVGCGPGSFVGIRVCMAYAKGFCLARNIPLVGVSSLLAASSALDQKDTPCTVLIKANKASFYAQKIALQSVIPAEAEVQDSSPSPASAGEGGGEGKEESLPSPAFAVAKSASPASRRGKDLDSCFYADDNPTSPRALCARPPIQGGVVAIGLEEPRIVLLDELNECPPPAIFLEPSLSAHDLWLQFIHQHQNAPIQNALHTLVPYYCRPPAIHISKPHKAS